MVFWPVLLADCMPLSAGTDSPLEKDDEIFQLRPGCREETTEREGTLTCHQFGIVLLY